MSVFLFLKLWNYTFFNILTENIAQMKLFNVLILLSSIFVFGACQTSRVQTNMKPQDLEVSGSIEVTKHAVEKTSENLCTIKGTIVDEDGEAMVGLSVSLKETNIGTICDIDGKYKIEKVPAGTHVIQLDRFDGGTCTVTLDLEEGDQVTLDAIIALRVEVELLKPIIYLYPEEKTEVEVSLKYDGKITTTYPKYPENGWKVSAAPDGTLTDQDNKSYYALYWEGVPRKPLEIADGFVVSRERTIPFLEEKLALLGLNSKEANEFIIFWLPVLEKNNFNLIRFAGDDYLKQAELKITPEPETSIRIAMIFKGLEEEMEVPIQDLTPLMKTRKGFTIVEWGGQELPKEYKLDL